MSRFEMFCERCGRHYGTEEASSAGSLPLGRRLLKSVGRGTNARRPPQDEPFLRFCLACRGYTCPSCWNEDAGFCQTCVPLPEPEVVAEQLVEPAPTLPAPAWPDSPAAIEFVIYPVVVEPWVAAPFVDEVSVAEPFVPEPFVPEPFVAPPIVAELLLPDPVAVQSLDEQIASAPELEPAVSDAAPSAEFAPEPVVVSGLLAATAPVVSAADTDWEWITAAVPEAETEPEVIPEPDWFVEPMAADFEREPEVVADPEPEGEPVMVAEAPGEPEVVAEPELEREPDPAAPFGAPLFRPLPPMGPIMPPLRTPIPSVGPRMDFEISTSPPAYLLPRAPQPTPFLPLIPAGLFDGPGPAIKPCTACALPVSARARFCRRCGSPQS